MFTKTFTDPQGETHTDAVFYVARVHYSVNTNESTNYNIEANIDGSGKATDNDTSSNLSYQMYYWANQAAKDAGNLPYILANTTDVGEWFYVANLHTDANYNSLTAEQMAEKHCQEVVLV